MLAAIEAEPERWDLSALDHLIVGGSAAPPSMLKGFDRHGLTIVHALGDDRDLAGRQHLAAGSRARRRLRGGAPAMPRAAGDRVAVRRDPRAQRRRRAGRVERRGHGRARGPRPVGGRAYHRGEGAEKFTDDGWFQTGDVVTIDEGGSLSLRPLQGPREVRGRWISSVDLENLLMAHPAVAEAAVIAIPDERWGERRWRPSSCARAPARPRTTCASTSPATTPSGSSPTVRVHRRDPADGDRQVQEDRAPRPVRGRAGRGRAQRTVSSCTIGRIGVEGVVLDLSVRWPVPPMSRTRPRGRASRGRRSCRSGAGCGSGPCRSSASGRPSAAPAPNSHASAASARASASGGRWA